MQVTIKNPTGANVAYMSREFRVTLPAGESVQDLTPEQIKLLKQHFGKHHPLIKIGEDEPKAKPAPAPAKTQASSKASSAPTANAGPTGGGKKDEVTV